MSRPLPRSGALALVVMFLLVGRVAAADGPAPSDPWPLQSGAPTRDVEAARSALDALDARRSALLHARLAPMMEGLTSATSEPSAGEGAGRFAVSPALALRGLKRAAKASQEADARTVPEVMQVLAASAFDGGLALPDLHVLPGPDGKVDRILKGQLRPQSIDDRPYVLRPSLLLRPSAVPPPPPPRSAPEPAGSRIVKGVRIEVDEALLRRALNAPGAPAEAPELAQLEERLLAASDGDAAARLLNAFAREKKQALLAVRAAPGSAPLVRVSLRALLEAAGTAPDAARTCGGLTRLVGVSVGEGHDDDVTLLGLVQAGEPALALESLTLALRYVWREGRVPGCSLDPDPKNPAGAQAVRIFGIAPDSGFARTMLEADYAMKRLVAAAPGAPRLAGLVDLPEAIASAGLGSDGRVSQRFWLTPAPPGPGDVLLSAEGAAALFDARVTVRSEEMQEDFALGTGRASPVSALVARSLTEHYDELARALPVFAELRGLFDAVYAAQVLRFLAPSHPLLERAAERAHASVAVPASYAGIHVVHPVGVGLITLEGGCEAATRLAAGALLDVEHPGFGLPAPSGAAPVVPRVVALGRSPAIEDLLLQAQAALSERRFEEAEDLATRALDLAPDDLAALALRGAARVRAGRVMGGLLDALEASRRAPHEPIYEANLRALLAEAGDEQAFVGISAPGAEMLSGTYLAQAAEAGLARRWTEAAQAADRALRLRPGSEQARVLKATLAWLSGDLVEARRLAEETAALLPRSADAHALVGWVSAMQGDLAAARAAFDLAIAVRAAADSLGSRSVLRLLAGDLTGAGADARAALDLDPTHWGTQLALQALRRAACLGIKRAQPELAAQLRLPPDVQLALFEAQQALALGQDDTAAQAYDRVLAALVPERVPAEVLEASHAREMACLMLARCLGLSANHDPESGARMAALLDEVERAHPGWVSPRWMRFTSAQRQGDIAVALRALATCRGADPAGDPLLVQFMPPTRACLDGFVALLECTLPLLSPGGPQAPEAAALERLRAVYRGGPSEAAADALAAVLARVSEGDAGPGAQQVQARLAEVVAAMASDRRRVLAPEEVLVRVSLLGGRIAGLLQEAGQDEAFASAVATLRALAPDPDIYESITTMVAEQRKQAFLGAITRFVRAVDGDPRGQVALRLATREPEAARRMMDEVVRPARDQAAALGEPLLAHFVDLALLGLVGGVEASALDARLARVRRVLEVALDPAKIERLRATEREVVARKAALEAELGGQAGERGAKLRADLRTPTDAKTQALLQREISQSAARRGRTPDAPDPLDVRRQAEIQLLASLRALGAPLPEGLK